jgi:hypothetical protein
MESRLQPDSHLQEKFDKLDSPFKVWHQVPPASFSDLATSFSAGPLCFLRGSIMMYCDNRRGSKFLEFHKGGRIMRYAALLLGIVFLLIFAACEKGEQPAKSEYQGAVEGEQQEPHGVTQAVEEKAGEAVEGVEEKTEEAVETLKEKTEEGVETVKKKAAEPFEGMAEKMGGHSEAAKEVME